MFRTYVASFVAGVLVFSSSTYSQQPTAPAVLAPAVGTPAAGAVHSHDSHGPHNGEILEVGREEYHVELVVDEAKKQVFVYLLDKTVKAYIALDAPFLAINLKISGKPAQVKLKPVPQEVDRPGFSSCFGITSSDLLDGLHDSHSDARLALKISNKPYIVRIVHDHDHTAHSHAGHTHAAPKKK